MRSRGFQIAFLLLFTVVVQGIGQVPFSMEAYLNTATVDQELELFRSQLNFLENNNYNKPWIQRVEVRVGSESADFKMDEYRLRLTPSYPAEIRANKIYHDQQVLNTTTNYEVALNKALKNRYQLLIDHYYNYSRSEMLTQKHQSIIEIVKLMEQNRSVGYDMGDFISVESNISDLLIEVSQLKMNIDEIEYFVSLDLPSSKAIAWDESDLISVEAIKSRISTIKLLEDDRNIYVRKAEQNVLLGQQMHKINISESKGNLGFIQSSLDYNRGKNLYDHFGLQIGLRLPIFNAEKPDLNREKFKLIKESEELRSAKLLVQRRSDYLNLKLENLFSQYDLLNERINRISDVKFVLPVDKNINMFHMIRHRTYNIDLMEKRFKIMKEIYETYIDYMDIKGHLVEQPLINYLSPTFKSIN